MTGLQKMHRKGALAMMKKPTRSARTKDPDPTTELEARRWLDHMKRELKSMKPGTPQHAALLRRIEKHQARMRAACMLFAPLNPGTQA